MASGSGSKKKVQVQLCLDFGQKKFGNVVCPECDMVYNYHEEQDRKQHEKFHTKQDLMAFPGWKAERVVASFDGCSGGERIIVVEQSDSKTHVNKVKEIVGDYIRPWLKVYLYVSSNKIVGYVVTEAVTEAVTDQFQLSEAQDKEDSVAAGTDQVAISGVWVKQFRRKKVILMRLLDTVRSSFIPGVLIPKQQIVFYCTEEETELVTGLYYGE